MSKFLSDRFSQLEPYTPGEQPQVERCIKLNTNESPYPPSEGVTRAIMQQASLLNRYPDPAAKELTMAMARHFNVAPQQVFLGNGSDEILAFCFQAFCPRGAAFADITYGFYPVYCQLYGVNARTVPLREDYSLAAEDYYNLKRTIFIANPNAPTGLALPMAALEKILRHNPDDLLVVDEAYVDFGAESALPLLARYDNLMIVGTFSKSRSLAGARLGYALASPALIADLERIKYSFNPYNLNRLTMAAGVAALEDDIYYRACARQSADLRDEVADALRKMDFSCTESQANFLFAAHPRLGGQALYRQLWERGILVRWFNKPRLDGHVRITVGTQQEMNELLFEIRKILRSAQEQGGRDEAGEDAALHRRD